MRTLLIFSVAVLAFFSGTMADEENIGLRTIARSTGGFANNFLKVIVSDNPGNLITSPLSVQVVTAMAAYGAGETTASQMRSTLLIPADDELGQSGYQSLIQTLNSAKGVQLSIANKLFTANQFSIKPAYKQLTATRFSSESQELDFSNPEAAANTINTWCEQQTNNRIHDVVTPDSLSSDTRLVLVNAVYFKGSWAKKFNPALTIDRPFHVDARTTKNVPTMFIKSNFRFGHLPEIDARFIEIPYEKEELSMVVILPNKIDGLQRVINGMDRVNLTHSLSRVYPHEVELMMPKWKIESSLNLNEPLQKMGMVDMFQSNANFFGIAETPLKVDKVIQKAFIEVNEEGSEAAAVTVVVGLGASAFVVQPLTFDIDHPFYYEIRSIHHEVPIFTGICVSP